MQQKKTSLSKRALAAFLCVTLLSSQPAFAMNRKQASFFSFALLPLASLKILDCLAAAEYYNLSAVALTKFDNITANNLTDTQQLQVNNFYNGTCGLNTGYMLPFAGLSSIDTVAIFISSLLLRPMCGLNWKKEQAVLEKERALVLKKILPAAFVIQLVLVMSPIYVTKLTANGEALPAYYDTFKNQSLVPLNEVGNKLNWVYYSEWIYVVFMVYFVALAQDCCGVLLPTPEPQETVPDDASQDAASQI